MSEVRNYQPSDYDQLVVLYKDSSLYGGQFDENRDSAERLHAITAQDPEAILVYEKDGRIYGTISLIEDGRVAWLFRFAVLKGDFTVTATEMLYARAAEIFKARGHRQVLVYSPVGDESLKERYSSLLGFNKGSDYTCFWKDI